MVTKTVMGAALVAAALSLSGQPASATVTQSVTAIGAPAPEGVQPVVVYRRYYGRPGWGHRYLGGGLYRPYAYGGFYPGYGYGYGWGYPGYWGYGWGPGIGIGIAPGFGIGFGF